MLLRATEWKQGVVGSAVELFWSVIRLLVVACTAVNSVNRNNKTLQNHVAADETPLLCLGDIFFLLASRSF